jgi:hypothetical protein
MAQGHALSFLARAFTVTGKSAFLEAGQRALALFERVKISEKCEYINKSYKG